MTSVFSAERLLFTPATPDTDAIPTIFAFPNEYSVGITSLGYQVVWASLAMRPDVAVSRLFTDTRESLPRNPELVGFSLSWELDYVNILNLLEFLEIPLASAPDPTPTPANNNKDFPGRRLKPEGKTSASGFGAYYSLLIFAHFTAAIAIFSQIIF